MADYFKQPMINSTIPYLHSVVFSKNTVYVSFKKDPGKQDISLVTAYDEVLFKFVDLSTNVVARLNAPQEHEVLVGSPANEIGTDDCKIYEDALTDWCVPGHPTIQIELPRQPGCKIKFLGPIVIKNAETPVRFEAWLAIHRARAKLEVEFIDLDAGNKKTEHVDFDPKCHGGIALEGYQKVEIRSPIAARNMELRLTVVVVGCTGTDNEPPPFVFLCDARARAGELDVLFDESGVENAQRYFWMYAKAKADLEGLDCGFIESQGKIEVIYTKAVDAARPYFDEHYYMLNNRDVDFSQIDPFTHYLLYGRKEYRNPNPEFSVREYYARHPSVEAARVDPLIHYANEGKAKGLLLGNCDAKLHEIWQGSIPDVSPDVILRRAQDLMVPMHLIQSRKLAVFVVPEHNAMSGGIYSIFSIADHARRMRRKHGYDVLVMTRPNSQGLTYVRNNAFRNSETVLRFEQLRLFSEVSELQIHIPEYATVEFVRSLSPELLQYLMRRDRVHVNILNQNIWLMPEAQNFCDLRRIADSIGQSVSHHAFFGQEWADRYNLATLLLPAYTDLSPYPPASFEEKENLIIYSDDEAPYRDAVLDRLSAMGDYELVKIADMHFDTYMDLATRCRFSVSFGEGFDGYVAQPMYQGGIGFALYTDEFFPDESYKNLENFFETEEEMIEQIVPTIRRLEADQQHYEALNKAMHKKWDELYDYNDYVGRIDKLMRMEYEVYPLPGDRRS